MADASTLARLRQRIQALEGAPRAHQQRIPSGWGPLDALLGGVCRPGLIELVGPPGSGAVRVAIELAAAQTRDRRRVAWLDGSRWFHPPTAEAFGVDLDRLLIVRPPATGEGSQRIWAVEQLLRSGCFGLVIVSEAIDPASGKLASLHRFAGQRWRQAAEKGGCTGVFLTQSVRGRRTLQPDVRLSVEGRRLSVLRDRTGRTGAIGLLPAWSDALVPEDSIDPLCG